MDDDEIQEMSARQSILGQSIAHAHDRIDSMELLVSGLVQQHGRRVESQETDESGADTQYAADALVLASALAAAITTTSQGPAAITRELISYLRTRPINEFAAESEVSADKVVHALAKIVDLLRNFLNEAENFAD